MRAFLAHQGVLYHSTNEDGAPHRTAVSNLIRGIWRVDPDRALGLLRNRIFTDHPLTPVCEGMIKVAGKRFQSLTPAEWESRFSGFEGAHRLLGPSHVGVNDHAFDPAPALPADLLAQFRSMARGIPAVSALLLDPDGHPLLGSWSRTSEDRTAHAEVNLVAAWFQRHRGPAPRGSTLHVSLRPCAMCAAQILALSPEPGSLRVVFHEEDPGPASKNSCLVPGTDLWLKAGSPAWRARFIKNQDE